MRKRSVAFAIAASALVLGTVPAAAGAGLSGTPFAWGDNSQGQLGLGDTSVKPTPTSFAMPVGVRFTSVTASGRGGLALDATGQAWGWGDNSAGEVGDGSTLQRPAPTRVSMPVSTRFTQISAGYDQSLAIDSTGTVWSWGGNSEGQLGTGSSAGSANTPAQVTFPAGVSITRVAGGFLTSFAVDTTGQAWAWGYGALGQLGDGAFTSSNVPVRVAMPGGVSFTSISGGYFWALALDTTGRAWAWGGGGNGQLGNGSTSNSGVPVAVSMPPGIAFASVSAAWQSGNALDTSGRAWTWGDNFHGELGNGTSGSSSGTDVPGLATTPSGVTFDTLSGGAFHVLALDQHGNGWAWGRGDTGQTGDGSMADHASPTPVTMPSGVRFTLPADSLGFALALDTAGVGWGWGQNTGTLADGETAGGSATPNAVSLPHSATAVAAGYDSGLAVDSTGQAWSWGQDAFGQLGNGDTVASKVPVGVSMPPGVRFTAVSAGAFFAVALDTSGRAWAWGVNDVGQLGNGDTAGPQTCQVEGASSACSLTPVQVSAPPGVVFTAVSAGGLHTLALDDHGGVWAWGSNGADQLGTVTSNDSSTPVQVSTPPDVTFTAVAAGYVHSMALDSNGNVWSWGSSTYGESGRNFTSAVPAPVTIPDTTKITGIAAGAYHSLAVDAAGAVWAWGLNSTGQLGDGTDTGPETCGGAQVPPAPGTPCSVVPVRTTSPAGVVFTAVAAGWDHSLALDGSGHVWGWGGSGLGQVGDGGTGTAQVTPSEALAPDTTTFSAIAAGSGFSLGIGANGGPSTTIPEASLEWLLIVAGAGVIATRFAFTVRRRRRR